MCKKVSASELPDPSKCYIVNYKEEATVGKKSSAFFQAVNFRGELYEEFVESLKCELVLVPVQEELWKGVDMTSMRLATSLPSRESTSCM